MSRNSSTLQNNLSPPQRRGDQYWRRDSVQENLEPVGTNASSEYWGAEESSFPNSFIPAIRLIKGVHAHSAKTHEEARPKLVSKNSTTWTASSNVSSSSNFQSTLQGEWEPYRQLIVQSDYSNIHVVGGAESIVHDIPGFVVARVSGEIASPIGMVVGAVYTIPLSEILYLPTQTQLFEGGSGIWQWPESPAFSLSLAGGDKPSRLSPIEEIAALSNAGRTIANRLRELEAQQIEEDPECDGISLGSKLCFLEMLRTTSGVKMPKMSVTPDGNIYATWRTSGSAIFSAHFLSNGDVRYVILRTDTHDKTYPIRSTGSAPASRVLKIPETASAHWVFE